MFPVSHGKSQRCCCQKCVLATPLFFRSFLSALLILLARSFLMILLYYSCQQIANNACAQSEHVMHLGPNFFRCYFIHQKPQVGVTCQYENCQSIISKLCLIMSILFFCRYAMVVKCQRHIIQMMHRLPNQWTKSLCHLEMT